MEQRLKWGSDLAKAKDEANKSNRLILLFFHSNTCSGCTMTISKTLPDNKVIEHIGTRFVPLMFEMGEPATQELKKCYNIEWTPTFIVADKNASEVYRMVGYLPPDSLRAHMAFGEAKHALRDENLDKASKCFSMVVENFPGSDLVPEAIYYHGVSMYKRNKDTSYLKKAFDALKSRFPENEWTKKASAWATF